VTETASVATVPNRTANSSGAAGSWVSAGETVKKTLAEAFRLSRSGVRLNVFMLERSPGLITFMERLARLTQGRVFLVRDTEMGSFILRDYASRRAS
jgi:uncharacterized protein with von Willebrand factor type A (vWA) domain